MNRRGKIAGVVVAFAILVANVTVSQAPASGYELSIYSETPFRFWVAISVVVLTGIAAGVGASDHFYRTAGAALAVGTTIYVAMLPYIRRYYFFGQADSLQHLGWAKDILQYSGEVWINPYPGLHFLAVNLTLLTGLPLNRTLVLSLPILYSVFVLGLLTLARSLGGYTERPGPGPSPAVLTLLLCVLTPPIIAVRLPNFQPIATVSGLFIVPFAIWTGLTFSFERRRETMRWFVIMALSLVSLVVFHPQQAAAAMGAILTALLVKRIFNPTRGYWSIHPKDRVVLLAVMVSGVVLYLWLTTRRVFINAIAALVGGLTAGTAVAEVASPDSGFAQIGGSLIELFAKTLLVPGFIGVLTVAASIVAILVIVNGTPDLPSLESHQRILAYVMGFTPVVGLFVLYVAAAGPAQALRYAGLLAGLGTPVAAIHLWRVQQRLTLHQAKAGLVTVLVLGAAISVPVMFASPYLYTGSKHVTEAQYTGYGWLFEHRDSGTSIGAVDTDVRRHFIAHQGYRSAIQSDVPVASSDRGDSLVPAHFNGANDSTWSIESSWYLLSTSFAREQHIRLYRGIRFSNADFQRVSASPRIAKVYSNGDVNVSLVTKSI